MKEETVELEETRVLLVGVDIGEENDFEHSIEELKSLAEAVGKRVAGIITQRMDNINKAFYIGTGKVAEVKEFACECEAEEVIFDNTLSPSQIRNLGKELDLPVLDRTNVILDIFALRARTREAKLQVETARLQYMLPRLVGMRESLGRQGGTSGSLSNKGVGEKKLELDRRKIEHRISELKKELEHIQQSRNTQRKKRNMSRIPQVALVGYTNAGKSTIMNHMVQHYGQSGEKKVLEKDMLFATLETSVRYIDMGDNTPFFLTDTVGFIHKLPHGLIKAFQSTLQEIKYADLLVQVVDYADENYKEHMEVTAETLKELETADIPQIVVYNKVDKTGMENLPKVTGNHIHMAAGQDVGIRELARMIQQRLYADWEECCFLIPYDKGSVASYFMENATILEQEYHEDGIWIRVNCHRQDIAKYAVYTVQVR